MSVIRIHKWMYKLFLILFIGAVFVSCNNDDDDNSNPAADNSINAVTGTFKGTLNIGGQDYYNAIVTVTKVDNSHVKVQAKSGEAYSSVTTKTLSAVNPVGVSIVGSDSEGSISYLMSTKALTVSTQKTSATDIIYLFQGTQQ
ncbi:hypothetical protein [Chryseobacterium tongliaoense]|uniref:hypothetical protein n=1 Tax=Chryseobacterium tongliaoense TaxID=3240933 RepID=UPI0035159B97